MIFCRVDNPTYTCVMASVVLSLIEHTGRIELQLNFFYPKSGTARLFIYK